MTYFLISLAGIFITIFFVIGTHEAAHFLAARLLGVKVLRFSIGFGKKLFHFQDRKQTEYVIALIPLGGYVKMLDESEAPVPPAELHLAFNRQPFYKKFIIVAAGPLANLLCAWILYWFIFMTGFVSIRPIIGEVIPLSIAAESGLKPNQEIIRVDEHVTPTWPSIMFRLIVHAGNRDRVTIETKDTQTASTQRFILDLSNWRMDDLTPDPLSSLGIQPYQPPIPLVIGRIAPGSPAEQAGLQLGDKILRVDQRSVKDWNAFIQLIAAKPGQSAELSIERHNKVFLLPIHIGSKRNILFQSTGYIGIGPHFQYPKTLLHKIQYAPLPALERAWQEIVDFTYFNLVVFGKIITGKISLQSLGGPITIFESAGDALNYGFLAFMGFLAFLSVSIGIINLLPIPGLDGGHLFIQLIEWVIRRPIPLPVLELAYRFGFILLFLVLIQALLNDILRL